MINISGATRLLVSLGNPNVGNPAVAVYNTLLAERNLDAVFVALEPDSIENAVAAIRAFGVAGGTITKPFKQTVLALLDDVDADASAIGAVNVVKNENGHLTGHNLDWVGAIGAIEAETALANKRVALLGAGGAGRAIAYGLVNCGAKVVIYNRTADKAQEVADAFGCEFGGTLSEVGMNFDVIVNATSIGMNTDANESPMTDSSTFASHPVVLDIVNRPATRLLTEATAAGCVTIKGGEMVKHLAPLLLELLVG